LKPDGREQSERGKYIVIQAEHREKTHSFRWEKKNENGIFSGTITPTRGFTFVHRKKKEKGKATHSLNGGRT